MFLILDKILTTINREGFRSLLKKLNRRTEYKFKRINYPSDLYTRKWNSIKNNYSGKRIFLIGNGPSLNKTPLHLLQNEHVMCFNRFNLMHERLNWTPDFYMITDNLLLDDMIPEIDTIKQDVKYLFLPDIHFRGNNYKSMINDDPKINWLVQKHGRGFSTDLPNVYLGGSVIYEGFQVLRHLGFSEVYFVGVDMNFKIHTSARPINNKETDIVSTEDDDPNHFDPRYFGKNRKYHQPESYVIDAILQNLKYLSENHISEDFRVFNAGFDSKVEFFQKCEFKELFSYSKSEERELINKLFSSKSNFKSLDDFMDVALSVNSLPNNRIHTHFRTHLDLALVLIKDYLTTHTPIGPFEDQYFFVKKEDVS